MMRGSFPLFLNLNSYSQGAPFCMVPKSWASMSKINSGAVGLVFGAGAGVGAGAVGDGLNDCDPLGAIVVLGASFLVSWALTPINKALKHTSKKKCFMIRVFKDQK